nr:MFS transporter [Kibdelosporangium sp. MJ126-NF4]
MRSETASLAAASIGLGVAVLDTTAVTVVLPAIGADLAIAGVELRWVPISYTLVFAALMLLGGSLGDRWGAVRVFAVGQVFFALAATTASLAGQFSVLIIARLCQGAAAAIVVPSSLAMLHAAYPNARKRSAALGVWGGVGGLAAAAGPLVGGTLGGGLGWQSVFLAHLPVTAAGLVLLTRAVPSPPRPERQIAVGRQVLGAAGLAGVALALVEGNFRTLSGWLTLAVGVAVLVLFGQIDRRSRAPVLPRALLADRDLGGAATVGLLLNFGFYGQLFVMTVHFGISRGYDELGIGLALAAQTVVGVVASPLGGRTAARHGPIRPIVLGLAIGAAGLSALAPVHHDTPYLLVLPGLVAVGFGTAFAMPAATSWALRTVPSDLAGVASGTFSASRQFGGTLGVAVLGGISLATGTIAAAALVAAGGYALACVVALTRSRPP